MDQSENSNSLLNGEDLLSIPGTASLADIVDTIVIVILRDGKRLIGMLRSYDQYANLILQDAVERFYWKNKFADVQRGVYLIRGESVVFLGELESNNEFQEPLEEVSLDEILTHINQEESIRRDQENLKTFFSSKQGFCRELSEFVDIY